jgi:hypothetical protein
MSWILIVVWYSTVTIHGGTMGGTGYGEGVTMQEFHTLKSCQFASIEIAKRTKNL